MFRGFLREVSGKIVESGAMGEWAVLRGKKPAGLELVSFENGKPSQDSGHGLGREYETSEFEDPGFRAEIPGHFRFPVPDIFQETTPPSQTPFNSLFRVPKGPIRTLSEAWSVYDVKPARALRIKHGQNMHFHE